MNNSVNIQRQLIFSSPRNNVFNATHSISQKLGYDWRVDEFYSRMNKDGGNYLNQNLDVHDLHESLNLVLENISSTQV